MILFIYSRKNVVDSVLPCGMPCVIFCVLDCAFVVCTVCRRFMKYVLKNARACGVKLNSCLSLCSNFLCDTVSYALDRSIYMPMVGCLFSLHLCISCLS